MLVLIPMWCKMHFVVAFHLDMFCEFMIFRQGTPHCVLGLLDLTYTSFMYCICLLGLYRLSHDFSYLGFVRRLGIQIF